MSFVCREESFRYTAPYGNVFPDNEDTALRTTLRTESFYLPSLGHYALRLPYEMHSLFCFAYRKLVK